MAPGEGTRYGRVALPTHSFDAFAAALFLTDGKALERLIKEVFIPDCLDWAALTRAIWQKNHYSELSSRMEGPDFAVMLSLVNSNEALIDRPPALKEVNIDHIWARRHFRNYYYILHARSNHGTVGPLEKHDELPFFVAKYKTKAQRIAVAYELTCLIHIQFAAGESIDLQDMEKSQWLHDLIDTWLPGVCNLFKV